MQIFVIGGGWYGVAIALWLRKFGHDVSLFEKNPEICSETSGKYGIRLHAGQHYQRSLKTRESCRRGLEEFYEVYPELIVEHQYSIYGLGNKDADGLPPKVDQDTFASVCKEFRFKDEISPEEKGYTNLISAMDINEPSIVLGARLREAFKKHLKDAGVNVICNFEVKEFEKYNDKIGIRVNEELMTFDRIVNATSYHALLPQRPLPFNMGVVYQPCLALVYKDRNPAKDPISFIVMDGWFPCLMPYCDSVEEDKKFDGKYIMTHGKYTIMGSYKTASEANKVLTELNNEFIETWVKPNCEREMERFWPEFADRFVYMGEWKASTIPKIVTNREFRSAVTFASNEVINGVEVNLIHIIPGKVSNVFDAAREVLSFIKKENIVTEGNYEYVKDGVLHESMSEITEKLEDEKRNTCMLQTYNQLKNEANQNMKSNALESNGKMKEREGSKRNQENANFLFFKQQASSGKSHDEGSSLQILPNHNVENSTEQPGI